jgi:hypothetical protein
MNKEIRVLENKLINILNTSDLPLEVKRIILGKLEAQMTNLSDREIFSETEVKEHAEGV